MSAALPVIVEEVTEECGPPWGFATEIVGKLYSIDVNELAGLSWQVFQADAAYLVNDTTRTIPNLFVNVRDDTNEALGTVRQRYQIIQNNEAPMFLDTLVDAGDGSYVSAGLLHGGSLVFWVMELLAGQHSIGATSFEHVIRPHIVLVNSHDGSTSIEVNVVPMWGMNTLCYDVEGAPSRSFRVRHTATVQDRIAEARHARDLATTYTAWLAPNVRKLVNTSCSEGQMTSLLSELWPMPVPRSRGKRASGDARYANQRAITLAQNVHLLIWDLYNASEYHGTLWGAVQAFQTYADHHTAFRQTEGFSKQENRFRAALRGNSLGTQAFARALTMR